MGMELFPKVEKINRALARKLTGMLLEENNNKVTLMLDDEEYLHEEVTKALKLLKTRKQKL